MDITKTRYTLPKYISIILLFFMGLILCISIYDFLDINTKKINKKINKKITNTNNIEIVSTKLNYIKRNKISFIIALKHKKNIQNLLEKNLLDISNFTSKNYGKYVKKIYIKNLVNKAVNNINNKKVIKWLKYLNIKKNEIYNYHDNIICKTNYKNIENLLKINLKQKKIYYEIPNNLKHIILFIEGLSINDYNNKKIKSNILKKQKKLKNKFIIKQKLVDKGYISKEVIANLYNIKNNNNNLKTNGICAVEYSKNSGFRQKDLLMSQFLNNIKQKKVKYIIGKNNNIDTESQLDIQMISLVDNNANIWYWNSDNWIYTSLVSIFNNNKIPDIISISWGGTEKQQCNYNKCTNKNIKKYINRVNIELVKLGLLGKTIVVSSGDSGPTNSNCKKNRPLNPLFPASSPWVISVGSTLIKNNIKNIENKYKTLFCEIFNCTKSKIEYGVNYDYVGWTSGSGFSNFQKTPYWQKKVVNNYLKSGVGLPINFNKLGRAYPDISVVGHNCPVFNYEDLEPVDGTSCSAPIFAGIVSLLNKYQESRGKSKLGFLNPLLYKMYENNIFNDIKVGYNWCSDKKCCPSKNNKSLYGYKSISGFDLVTGLGTPNVEKMKMWLFKNT